MNYWLLKCEPDHDYSYQELEKDGKTYWDGVTNNWALKFIREVSKGDKAFIYHTGNQRCVAGVANEFRRGPVEKNIVTIPFCPQN